MAFQNESGIAWINFIFRSKQSVKTRFSLSMKPRDVDEKLFWVEDGDKSVSSPGLLNVTWQTQRLDNTTVKIIKRKSVFMASNGLQPFDVKLLLKLSRKFSTRNELSEVFLKRFQWETFLGFSASQYWSSCLQELHISRRKTLSVKIDEVCKWVITRLTWFADKRLLRRQWSSYSEEIYIISLCLIDLNTESSRKVSIWIKFWAFVYSSELFRNGLKHLKILAPN